MHTCNGTVINASSKVIFLQESLDTNSKQQA